MLLLFLNFSKKGFGDTLYVNSTILFTVEFKSY